MGSGIEIPATSAVSPLSRNRRTPPLAVMSGTASARATCIARLAASRSAVGKLLVERSVAGGNAPGAASSIGGRGQFGIVAADQVGRAAGALSAIR
jgi:hypothetical protein